MDRERWQHIESLFGQVVEIEQADQVAWLEEHCADQEIRSEVISLLQADQSDNGSAVKIGQAISRLAQDKLSPGRSELIGKTIGPYTLIRQIGIGGMGTVYLAERSDGTFEQQVAIKLLNPAVLTEHSRQRFYSERQILADLDHPNIARLIDGGESKDGLPYLVLEYVEGLRIDEFCSTKNLSIKDRCRLFLSACDAVQFAHARLIVHRDLKPSNILVTEQGQSKLLDFGIAKLLEGGVSDLTMSVYGQPMTPQYASPEQRAGETVTTASDVYSLGLLFYLMLTGELPGQGRAANRSELRGDLDNIVMMAIREDPARRYASASALADDVRRYLRNEPVSARVDSWAYRAGKFIQRNRQGIAVAMVMVIGLMITVMIYTHQLASERDRSALEADKANRISDFMVNIFRSADPVNSKGGELTAVDLLDQAVTSISTDLSEYPETRGYLLTVMAESYRELDEFEKALTATDEAITAFKATAPLPGRALTRSLMLSGIVYRMMGAYQAALVPMLEAKELVQMEEYHSDGLEAWVFNSLGLLYKELGEFDQAKQLLQASVQKTIRAVGEIHHETADAMNNYAITVLQLGDDRLAADYACRAADIGEQVLPRLHSNLATFIHNCGRAQRALGHFDEAQSLMTESLSRRSELMGARGYETLSSYLELSDLYRMRGQFDLSHQFIESALEVIQSSQTPIRIHWGRYYRALGQLQLSRGETDAALDSLTQAYEIHLDVLGAEHLTVELIAVDEARALIKAGEPASAETLLSETGSYLDEHFESDNMLRYQFLLARAELALVQDNRAAAVDDYSLALEICEINIGRDSWCSAEPVNALNGLRL